MIRPYSFDQLRASSRYIFSHLLIYTLNNVIFTVGFNVRRKAVFIYDVHKERGRSNRKVWGNFAGGCGCCFWRVGFPETLDVCKSKTCFIINLSFYNEDTECTIAFHERKLGKHVFALLTVLLQTGKYCVL